MAKRKWEYAEGAVPLKMIHKLMDWLNECDENGWELVCYDEAADRYIFRRPFIAAKPPKARKKR